MGPARNPHGATAATAAAKTTTTTIKENERTTSANFNNSLIMSLSKILRDQENETNYFLGSIAKIS